MGIFTGLVVTVIVCIGGFIFIKICCGVCRGDCEWKPSTGRGSKRKRRTRSQPRSDGGEDGGDHDEGSGKECARPGGGWDRIRSGGGERSRKGSDKSLLENELKSKAMTRWKRKSPS